MSELLYPYGFIYETTNLVNGKKYIGSHVRSQDITDPDDSWYLGSGKYLNHAIAKYGKENFVRIILENVDTEEGLKVREEYYLDFYNCAKSPVYYNLTNSSYRGGIKGYEFSEESKSRISESLKGRRFSEEHKHNLSESLKGVRHSPESILKMADSLRGRKLPDEVKKKISDTLRDPNHNPMSHPEYRMKVAESKLNKIWVNKDGKQTYINPEELDEYIELGYSIGMIKRKGSTRKDYDRCCKVCGIEYKGGKYSNMCKTCYSKMKSEQLALTRGGNSNE